ncbi:MAG: glycosyltransferase [Pseudorhizobium sp.]
MTDILYLAHDLSDAAVRRRVMMLVAGGARVTVAGFQRAANVFVDDPEVPVIVLGHTADARLGQRAAAVVLAAVSLRKKLAKVPRPKVIIARNLEMLALAGRASMLLGGAIPIVYECLDIHRLMLDDGFKGNLLRRAEGYFGRDVRLLLTSSPAFVEEYFQRRSKLSLPALLLENKVLDLEGTALKPAARPPVPQAGEPWRIGWFGAIRCRKSLEILTEFAARMEGRVEIVLRGRPAYSEFEDFDEQVRRAPHVEFHGAYRNPEDLEDIYSDVHFVWAIDFFEEGMNSEWLLPNRLYEGSLYGAVPIARASTETGRFLVELDAGMVVGNVTAADLVLAFRSMDVQRYHALSERMGATDRTCWVTGRQECQALVHQLAALYHASALDPTFAVPSPIRSRGTP